VHTKYEDVLSGAHVLGIIGENVPVLVSEIDSTWLKAQRCARPGPLQYFPVPLGLHYTGRTRRYQARGSRSGRLQSQRLLASTMPLARFGKAFQRQAARADPPPQHVLWSDGEEGLERLRENHFPQALWLWDRGHIAQAVRTFVTHDQAEDRRLLAPIWHADSEAALEALRTRALRPQRPKLFRELFGCLLGNREGIDNGKALPAALRRSVGRALAPVKCGSGAVEKNVEVPINRRFKRQGRSWNPQRAERLPQLKLLCADERR
jgi:hypothetical protein